MGDLSVLLLGSPVVERDSQPVRFDTRKAIALLAYLTVTGQPQGRDVLAGLLWPDSDTEHARAALRRTLSALNAAVGEGLVRADRRTIELDTSAVEVDARRFRALVAVPRGHGHAAAESCPSCLTALDEAVGLYRGDFLAGFSLRDADPFDEWQFFEAEELRRELAGALERLVGALTTAGRYDDAITHARRWLAIDPLHEPAHQALMRLYAAAGHRGAALRQYRDCVGVLERELGVAPLEETVELFQTISEDRLRFPATPPPAPPPPPARRRRLPLVGRDGEEAALVEAWVAARDAPSVGIVEGEAGIGKSRLIEAVADQARAVGGVVLAARCYQDQQDLAYVPIVDALRAAVETPASVQALDAVADHWLAEATRLLPDLAGLRPDLDPPPPLDGPAGRTHFLEGVAHVLAAACSGTEPGMLVVEDLQWADEASLDLLTYLVRRLEGRGLLLVLSWRTEEVPPDGRPRLLAAGAQRSATTTVIKLKPLTPAAVAELVEARVGAGDAALAARLHAETDGLPLFVVQYLEALADRPADAEGPWAVPAGVREVLTERIRAVGEPARQLLTTAALIGRSFDPDTLRVASGRSDEETVAGLEELLVRGLVREMSDETRYDFAHEQVRTLVAHGTTMARRRLLHRRIADALATRPRAAGLASRIAHHYQEAGADEEAAAYHAVAARNAHATHAHAEALSHVDAALALGFPDPAELHELAADVLTLLGDYRQALHRYQAAAALAEPARLPGLEHKLGILNHRRGEFDLAEAHFAAALEGFAQHGGAGETARVRADWSLTAHRRERDAEASALAEAALGDATTTRDGLALAQAHNILGILAKARGDIDEATGHLRQSVDLAEQLGDLAARLAALNNLAMAQAAAGDLDTALALAAEALELCTRIGDRHHAAALHNNLADLLHAAGRRDEAIDHLKQAVPIFAEIGAAAAEDAQPEIWKLTEW